MKRETPGTSWEPRHLSPPGLPEPSNPPGTLTLIVFAIYTLRRKFYFKKYPWSHNDNTALINHISLFDTALVMTNTLIFNSNFLKINFLTNKEVKREKIYPNAIRVNRQTKWPTKTAALLQKYDVSSLN